MSGNAKKWIDLEENERRKWSATENSEKEGELVRAHFIG